MKRLITSVDKNSIAEKLGIAPMDKLISINGAASFDFFDYFDAMVKPSMEILIEKADSNEQLTLTINKDDFEDIGLTFEDGLMDNAMSCRNNCVFCFIHQNPKGILRDTIYFCDDDYRLSYMHGNYITLTNLNDRTVERIIDKRISPLNISVHTTDKNRRSYMMGNSRAGRNLKYLEQLANGGIILGMQIVLCKGINDEEHLDKTIYDLSRLVPHGGDGFSLSVVPVGLTKYREENRLTHLRPLNDFDCANAIAQVEIWQERLLEELGTRFVYLADEFYLTAGVDMPPYEAYEDFLQIENGVGMLASFKHDFEIARKVGRAFPLNAQGEKALWSPGTKVTLITGVSAQNFMRDIIPREITDIDIKVIRNEFFGENVTVSGLLTGQDIINQLRGKPLGDVLLLPSNCLRRGEDVLLDNITISDIAKELGVRVLAINTDGKEFAEALKGCEAI